MPVPELGSKTFLITKKTACTTTIWIWAKIPDNFHGLQFAISNQMMFGRYFTTSRAESGMESPPPIRPFDQLEELASTSTEENLFMHNLRVCVNDDNFEFFEGSKGLDCLENFFDFSSSLKRWRHSTKSFFWNLFWGFLVTKDWKKGATPKIGVPKLKVN